MNIIASLASYAIGHSEIGGGALDLNIMETETFQMTLKIINAFNAALLMNVPFERIKCHI